MVTTNNPLQQLIIERIRREGPIPFAEYMRMALYEPGYGYYVTDPPKMGWEGDYYTSTDVSSLFADCLGRQLEHMWEKLGKPAKFLVMEQGAGRGHLEQGVRTWAEQQTPDFNAALDYSIQDIRFGQDVIASFAPDERNQVSNARTTQGPPESFSKGSRKGDHKGPLPSTPPPEQAEIEKLEGDHKGPLPSTPPPESRKGDHKGPLPSTPPPPPLLYNEAAWVPEQKPAVFLSNELIDAFPVHIVEVRNGGLYEVYVDVLDGRLSEVLDEPSSSEVASYLDNFKIPWRTFGDGWRAEINLDALRWMEQTARHLGRGFILTIDYGDKAEALYTRFRRRGTLACYFQHSMNERPLARPGEQDITAHVNFSALIAEGRRHGLRLSKYTTQGRWLESLGIFEELEQIKQRDYAEADTARATDRGQIALFKWYNLRQRVLALTDPAAMGNFKVLILRR